MNKGEGRPDSLTLAAFFLFVLLGGANFVAVRFSNRALEPFWGAGLRFGLAAMIFFAVLAARRLPIPKGRALVGAVLFGILNFAAGYALVYWGFLEAPAGLGSVILALVPLLTLLLASLHGLEAFHWRGLVGALLAVVGIGVMFSQGLAGDVSLASILALVAGAACIAESGIVIKKFPRTDPITTNAVAMAVGSPLLLLLSLFSGERWAIPSKTETWITLAYVVFLGSVGLFILVIYVLKRWTASATSYSFVLFPVVATSLGALIGGEPIRAGVLIGGFIVMAAVYFGAISAPSEAPQLDRSGPD